MKIFNRLMFSIHRISGTLMCLVFIVWFLSAFVMMYHRFPRVSPGEQLQRQELLSASDEPLPSMTELAARLPEGEKLRDLTLERIMGQTLFKVRTNKGSYELPANPDEPLPVLDRDYFLRAASLWCSAPIERIDTLQQLDQWIPFAELKKEMPVYKVFFTDDDRTQAYFSSQTGKVLQFSTHSERVWAWLGAIPHWAYFTWLRQDVELWSKCIIGLGAIGCLMLLSGFWVTVTVWRKGRKEPQHCFSPYRKKWYHWHYVSGIFFGIFALTFTFSGLMSVAEIPEWIHKPVLKNPNRTIQASMPNPEQYVADYRAVLKAHPDTKRLLWNNFDGYPYYTLKRKKGADLYISAADSTLNPLHLTEKQVFDAVKGLYEKNDTQNVTMDIREIHDFDLYYRDMSGMYRGHPQLPAWKITVDDADCSVFYIQPLTGNIRYVNTTARWKYWTYMALHRLRIPGLNSNSTLRKGVLWVLLLGGTAISVTGFVLSVNYLRRKCRPNKKKAS